jgi:hypothetical protein
MAPRAVMGGIQQFAGSLAHELADDDLRADPPSRGSC